MSAPLCVCGHESYAHSEGCGWDMCCCIGYVMELDEYESEERRKEIVAKARRKHPRTRDDRQADADHECACWQAGYECGLSVNY